MMNTYSTLLLCYIQLQDKIQAAYEQKNASKDLIDILRLLYRAVCEASNEYENHALFSDLENKVEEDLESLKKYSPDVFKNRY